MGSVKLNRLQRVGLVIAALLIACFLYEEITENGIDQTSWLPPILAIAALLLVAAHGFELRTSVAVLKGRKLALLIAAATIPVLGYIGLTLFSEKRAEEPAYVDDDVALGERIRADDKEWLAKQRAKYLAVPSSPPPTRDLFSTHQFDRGGVELPNDWRWLNRADAASLDAMAEAITDARGLGTKGEANNVLVAGNALDNAKKAIATIRLSVRPGEAASQIEMRQALREPQAELTREIVAEAEKTASAMRRLPTTSFYRVTGGALRQNASVVCLWTAFEYDVGKGPTASDTWVCPLGDRTLKLSTSYAKTHAARFAMVIDHVWRSLDAR